MMILQILSYTAKVVNPKHLAAATARIRWVGRQDDGMLTGAVAMPTQCTSAKNFLPSKHDCCSRQVETINAQQAGQ